ncbi:protein GAMETE EXPRESSED 1-like [Vicia villosa]|uniref:protein GAMETE EXPRESSED 1-like n=1 Tax=Vicia villosa TaxID=3911 RepID=UPI00273ABFCA|nr:protein GAMETE EXPRESSED 1-like [Vicia villosa]
MNIASSCPILMTNNYYAQFVAQTVKNVEGDIDVVLTHSKSVYEQTTKIEASQLQLKEGQEDMKRNLEDGVALLKESYSYLGKEIEKLRDEAIEIENEVIKVGDAMSSKMNNLQNKAQDIGNMAGISLDKQQQLLDGQSTALKGLNSLNELQFKALEESRKSLQYFAQYGHRQQEELLKRQEQIQGLHDRLMENSKTILSAQESFEAKQATMFVALDKLFALQNAMLLESRVIKAFFIYFISICVVFMLTSTKLTYNIRPLLYIELCATLVVEVLLIRLISDDNMEKQTWIINKVRLLFMVAALVQLLYAICTYKDFERMNHQMLLTLVNKINNIQNIEETSSNLDNDDDDINWSQWIDNDLSKDVNDLDDPDFIIPEEVAEKSIIISPNTKSYNLRLLNRLH